MISVDTKKKELVGDLKNGGREWQPAGSPVPVRVHDFLDKELGKAIPYGVYDLLRNEGWVNVGIDHDTAAFAVASIDRWWKRMVSRPIRTPRSYSLRRMQAAPTTREFDSGRQSSSASPTNRAPHPRESLHAGYQPMEQIEHRMFCHITQNRRGPLESLETVVNLIAATTTEKGLQIRAAADKRRYPDKIKVSDDELATVSIKRSRRRGAWDYVVKPR